MVIDLASMTIRVGSWVSDKPDLLRRPEWDFDFKGQICGYPDSARDTKTWNKFYSEMLGCKFNRRFFGANYHVWIASKMTQRTGNMLSHEGKHWKQYNVDLVHMAHAVLPYINEAERDGLYNLIPIIIAYGAAPQAIRSEIGRGAWRRIANNSPSRNRLIMNAMLRCQAPERSAAFFRLLEIPSGVMRAIHGAEENEIIAARLAPRKRIPEFMQTLHIVRDTRDMLTPHEFNPQWGLARMRQEHEDATKALMRGHYSDKRFADDWAFEDGCYTAALLTSQAEIATEGATQHHCVASYARGAAKGQYLVFRIDGKERATAGIVGGQVDQVYCACNAAPSDECVAFTHKLAKAYAAAISKENRAA